MVPPAFVIHINGMTHVAEVTRSGCREWKHLALRANGRSRPSYDRPAPSGRLDPCEGKKMKWKDRPDRAASHLYGGSLFARRAIEWLRALFSAGIIRLEKQKSILSPLEVLHGGVSGVTDPLSCQHLPCREQDDAKIQEKGAMINVPDVQVKAPLPVRHISTIDLRPTCEARVDVMAAHLMRSVKRKILHQERAWTDDTHVSAQDIHKLGKLVQAQRTDDPPELGQADSISEWLALFIRRLGHRSELVDMERATFVTGSDLREEDRRALKDPNTKRDQEDQRREHDQRH